MSIKQNYYQFRYKYGFNFRPKGFVWESWMSHLNLTESSTFCVEILWPDHLVKKAHGIIQDYFTHQSYHLEWKDR